MPEKPIPAARWVTVTEAARFLSATPETVAKWAREGKFATKSLGKELRVWLPDVLTDDAGVTRESSCSDDDVTPAGVA